MLGRGRRGMREKSSLCALLALALTGAATARADEARKPGDVFTLGEVEVSAKGEQLQTTTTERVTGEELRQYERNTVSTALNMLPGVTLSQVGARNESMIFVRGLDLRHVPLFLDGIPIYVPYDGYPDLGRFMTYDVSEIILTKGFTSALYGPNTMGGSINLVSRRPDRPFEGEAGVGWFSGDGRQIYANFGTGHRLWYLQGGASYVKQDDFPLAKDYVATKTEDGDTRDNSYSKDDKVNLKLGFTPWEGHEYALSYWHQHGEKGVPVYAGKDSTASLRYWQWPYWDADGYYFNSKTPLGQSSYVKTNAYYDNYNNSIYAYDNDNYNTMTKKSSFKSEYRDHTYGGEIEAGSSLIPYNLVKLAVHYKMDVHNEHNKPAPWQTYKARTESAGLEDTITFTKKFYAIAGVSYDLYQVLKAEDWSYADHRDFDKADTHAWNPQAGLFYALTDTGKVSLTASRKSRFPGIKDLYSYKLGTAIPNAGLEPERANSYDLAYEELFWKKLAFKSTVFYRDIKDYFLSVAVPDPSNATKTINQTQNIGHVVQRGVELEANASLTPDWDVGASYSYTYSDNKTNDDDLTDIPRHKLFAQTRYSPAEHLNLFADVEYNSKRFSSANKPAATTSNPNPIQRVAGAFTVVNVKATYEVWKGLKAEVGVKNLLDRDYALQEGYPMPGRTYFTNLTYTY